MSKAIADMTLGEALRVWKDRSAEDRADVPGFAWIGEAYPSVYPKGAFTGDPDRLDVEKHDAIEDIRASGIPIIDVRQVGPILPLLVAMAPRIRFDLSQVRDPVPEDLIPLVKDTLSSIELWAYWWVQQGAEVANVTLPSDEEAEAGFRAVDEAGRQLNAELEARGLN